MTAKPPATTRTQGFGMRFAIWCSAKWMVLQNRMDTMAHSAASAATFSSITTSSSGMDTVKRVGSTPMARDTP